MKFIRLTKEDGDIVAIQVQDIGYYHPVSGDFRKKYPNLNTQVVLKSSGSSWKVQETRDEIDKKLGILGVFLA